MNINREKIFPSAPFGVKRRKKLFPNGFEGHRPASEEKESYFGQTAGGEWLKVPR